MSRFDKLEIGKGNSIPKEDEPPQDAPLWDTAAFLERGMNAFYYCDYESALRGFSKAIDETPDSIDGWFGCIYCLLRMRRLEHAGRMLDRFRAVAPKTAAFESAYALKASLEGRSESARSSSRHTAKMRSSQVLVWLGIGEAMLPIQPRLAESYFMEMARLGVNDSAWPHWAVFYQLGQIHLTHGNLRDAEEIVRAGITSNLQSYELWHLLGNTLYRRGDSSYREILVHAQELSKGTSHYLSVVIRRMPMRNRIKGIFQRFKPLKSKNILKGLTCNSGISLNKL